MKLRNSYNASTLIELLGAISFATWAHRGQKRGGKDEEPYVTHPLAVCTILLMCNIDGVEILIASILHDILEDTKVKPGELIEKYGEMVTWYVELVSKREGVSTEDYYTGIASSPEASMIKIADRIHNLCTMQDFFSTKKQASYIAETEKYILPLTKHANKKLTELLEVTIKLAEPLSLI